MFAWNLGGRLTAFGKKQIALNVIERGRAWHWTKLPKGWFDLDFCLTHGQKKTKQTLRELFPEESRLMATNQAVAQATLKSKPTER